jgi:hypothetical protein
MICTGQSNIEKIDLENLDHSNNRVMAANNILQDIGIQAQVGKRTDVFWIALAVIASGVLITVSIFSKKKSRRRR